MDDKGYEQVCISYRQLTDVRFKLLSFVPAISGAAITLLSKDLEIFKEDPIPRLVISILGFLVTIGIVIYDQRNSQLYNALVKRGCKLEDELNIRATFSARQPRSLRLFGLFSIWHDRGLALIYGSVLGAWMFPFVCGFLWSTKFNVGSFSVPTLATIIAAVSVFIFVFELHRLDKRA